MGHHDFTELERQRYEALQQMYGEENNHISQVLVSGKWTEGEDGLKHCWYCGSLEPAQLLELFKSEKVTGYSGSDWKYGYPHKFYIDVDSGKPAVPYYTINDERVTKEEYLRALADRNYKTNPLGGRSIGSGNEPGTGTIRAKFYTEHLIDVEDAEIFKQLQKELEKRFHIRFEISDGKLMYRAPSHGYQV